MEIVTYHDSNIDVQECSESTDGRLCETDYGLGNIPLPIASHQLDSFRFFQCALNMLTLTLSEKLTIVLVILLPIENNALVQKVDRPSSAMKMGRRDLLQATGVLSGTFLSGLMPFPARGSETIDSRFDAYQVLPDASAELNPSLISVEKDSFLNMICSLNGAVWLGEHHNSAKDHLLQAEVLDKVHSLRSEAGRGPISVGLEQVQVQFQPVLDDFNSGVLSISDMRKLVEWDTRWMWPFEVYEPVFAKARDLNIPLIALNVNSEDLAFVEKSGLPGLPKEKLFQYIKDGPGFAQFATQREFKTYVDYVIRPSYDMHQAMGLLKYSIAGERLEEEMSYRNFLSGRILWDEAMAANANVWNRKNPDGLLLGLVGADHVKFRNGIPARYSRMAGAAGLDCLSVMLNPTLIDTRPSGTVANVEASFTANQPDFLTLQLRYLKDEVAVDSEERSLPTSTGGVLPLADYLLIG